MAKSLDQKMDADEESIDANNIEEEAEEEAKEGGGGVLRKKRKSEEEKDKEMEEEDTLVTKLDLQPGRQEHQQLNEHTIRLANRTKRNGCFFKQLIINI